MLTIRRLLIASKISANIKSQMPSTESQNLADSFLHSFFFHTKLSKSGTELDNGANSDTLPATIECGQSLDVLHQTT